MNVSLHLRIQRTIIASAFMVGSLMGVGFLILKYRQPVESGIHPGWEDVFLAITSLYGFYLAISIFRLMRRDRESKDEPS